MAKKEEIKVPIEPKGQMLPATQGGVYMPPFKMRAILEQLKQSEESEAH